MRHPCPKCGEDVGELTDNADGLAGHLAVRALEVRDGRVTVKCRRCSHRFGLPLRLERAADEEQPARRASTGRVRVLVPTRRTA